MQHVKDTSHTHPAPPAASGDDGERTLSFHPPLYSQRAQLVHRALQRYGCRRLVDAGCSDGDLLMYLINASSLTASQLTEVTAFDLDEKALAAAGRVLPFSFSPSVLYTRDATIRLVHGDLTSSAPVPPSLFLHPAKQSVGDGGGAYTQASTIVDAVVSIEVVEHIPPHLVAAYTYTLFAGLGAARGARLLILTTPNRDQNFRLPPLPLQETPLSSDPPGNGNGPREEDLVNSIYRPWEGAPRRRHDEHFFELTRAQWLRYVRYIEDVYGRYWCVSEAVLLGEGFTQGTVFVAREGCCTGGERKGDDQPCPSGFASAIQRIGAASGVEHMGDALPREDVDGVAGGFAREDAIAAFPFEEVFGMSASAYAQQFLASRPNQTDASSTKGVDTPPSLPLITTKEVQTDVDWDIIGLQRLTAASKGPRKVCTCIETRVLRGVPLWERLQAVVREGYNRLPRPSFTSTESPSYSSLSLTSVVQAPCPFNSFYDAMLAPALYVLREQCELELLLQSLEEQREAWRAAVWADWRRWTLYVQTQKRQGMHIRACGLQRDDALTSAASCTLSQPRRTSLPGPALSYTDLLPNDAVPSQRKTCAPPPPPLFCWPSAASELLSSFTVPSGVAAVQTEGLRLLRCGVQSSHGWLLAAWLCAQVLARAQGTEDAEEEKRRKSRQQPRRCVQAGQSINVAGQLSMAAAQAEENMVTAKDLPRHTRQALLLLASVDVLSSTYAALGVSKWGGRVSHALSLRRAVLMPAPSASAFSKSRNVIDGSSPGLSHHHRRRTISSAITVTTLPAGHMAPSTSRRPQLSVKDTDGKSRVPAGDCLKRKERETPWLTALLQTLVE